MLACLSRSRQATLIRLLSSFDCCILPNNINPSSFQITIQSESLLCYESHLIKYLSWNMKITTLQEKKPTIEVTIWSRRKNTAIQQSLDNMTNMLSSCLNYKLMYLYRLIDACLNYHVHLHSISTGNIYSPIKVKHHLTCFNNIFSNNELISNRFAVVVTCTHILTYL
jgi:hypothetical protein